MMCRLYLRIKQSDLLNFGKESTELRRTWYVYLRVPHVGVCLLYGYCAGSSQLLCSFKVCTMKLYLELVQFILGLL